MENCRIFLKILDAKERLLEPDALIIPSNVCTSFQIQCLKIGFEISKLYRCQNGDMSNHNIKK
jgi:hypothetical protein